MNTILHKVQTYLDKVSREPVVISEELVDAFGESCKAILRKQFSEERQSQFKPRMSNIGRPLCQLQMEAKGIKGEGAPYNSKMRNTFGDLIEALSIFVMKSAGVEIKNEQKEVTHKFGKQSIDGKQDVGILKVHRHILLKKNLVKMVDLRQLLRKIPLVMQHKDIYMPIAKRKILVGG